MSELKPFHLSRRFHPNDFAEMVIPDWIKRPHIDIWGDNVLRAISASKTGNRRRHIIANAPPRHGKTHFFDWALPCWYLERYPKNQVILATHTLGLSAKYSYRVRNTIEGAPKTFSVKIDQSSRDKKQWFTTQGGGMRAAGVGTAIQGDPAHLFVFDDLYANRRQANSVKYAEWLMGWYHDTARTRIEPDGIMIWSITRWFDGDVISHLKKMMERDKVADQFIYINFPAIATEDESFRKKGEALWPERYNLDSLETIRASVSPVTWFSLYQGEPKSDYGKMIQSRYFRYAVINTEGAEEYIRIVQDDLTIKNIIKSSCKWFQFIDTALIAEESADYTAVVTVGITPDNDVVIYDVAREHVDSDVIWEYLHQQWKKHFPLVKRQFIEFKQSGITAFQTGIKRGIPLFKLRTEGSKEIRAMPMQEQYQSGKVFHVSSMGLLKVMEEELTSFPRAPHDDIFDCIAYCCGAMQSDAMWTKESKFPYYGIRYSNDVGTVHTLPRQAPGVQQKRTPFGITSKPNNITSGSLIEDWMIAKDSRDEPNKEGWNQLQHHRRQ